MLISVIVPIYNLERLIGRCLDSLVNQTYENLEIICIDDGSTDTSPTVLTQYSKRDDRIRIITKNNEGLPLARKSGLEKSTGEFIIHVDDDYYLEPNAIELLVARQRETEADLVIADYFTEKEDSSEQHPCTDYRFDILDGKTFLLALLTEEKYFIWGKLIRKSLYKNVFIPGEVHYTEDMIGMVQLAIHARSIAKINSPLYHYIKREGALTHVLSAKSFQDWYKAIRLTDDYCRKLPNNGLLLQPLLDRETAQADVYLRHTRITGYYRKDIRALSWKLISHYRSQGRKALSKLPISNRIILMMGLISPRMASGIYHLYSTFIRNGHS